MCRRVRLSVGLSVCLSACLFVLYGNFAPGAAPTLIAKFHGYNILPQDNRRPSPSPRWENFDRGYAHLQVPKNYTHLARFFES